MFAREVRWKGSIASFQGEIGKLHTLHGWLRVGGLLANESFFSTHQSCCSCRSLEPLAGLAGPVLEGVFKRFEWEITEEFFFSF